MDTIDLVDRIEDLIRLSIRQNECRSAHTLYDSLAEDIKLCKRDIVDGLRERSAQVGIVSDGTNKIHIS